MKLASFYKKIQNFYKKLQAAGVSTLRPPSVIPFFYTGLLNTSPNLYICTFCFWFGPFAYSKILIWRKHTGHGFFQSPISLPHKKFVTLEKISDDVTTCDLWFAPPQSKIVAPPVGQTQLGQSCSSTDCGALKLCS